MSAWSLNSTVFAELDWQRLHGQPGLGFYRLVAHIGVTFHGKPDGAEVTVTNIDGELLVRGKDNQEHYLGYLRRQGATYPFATYQHTATGSITLEIELDAGRIEAIERIRLGGDLFFKLTLYGSAYGGGDTHSRAVQDVLHFRANQSSWIEILDQMGYRQTMLLEIPVAGGEISPQLSEAAKHLQTAQAHLLRGHFRDAVGACRDVMELLSAALTDEEGQLPGTIKAWFDDTRSMGKGERLRIVRRALKVLAHPARHADQVATSIEWGPTDARAAIIMAAALLQLAGES